MPSVIAVSTSSTHSFSKSTVDHIDVVAGRGVVGDAHFGETVQHLSRIAKNPNVPNLRQVHLIHSELFEELAEQGFHVEAGQLGENILTRDVALLDLPAKTRLKIGPHVELELTGLRNPCSQLDDFQDGLMQALIEKTSSGDIVRKAGVMAIVVAGGIIRTNDPINIVLPAGESEPLKPV